MFLVRTTISSPRTVWSKAQGDFGPELYRLRDYSALPTIGGNLGACHVRYT